MPHQGANYYLPSPPMPLVPGTQANAEDINTVLQDVAQGITDSIAKTGAVLTSAMNANNQNITGINTLGAATANISGTATIGTVNVTTENVSGNAGVAGNLSVTGTTTCSTINSSANVNCLDVHCRVLYSSSDADVSGNGNITNNLSVGGWISASGTITANGVLYANAGISSNGNIYGNYLQSNGNIQSSGDLHVNGWIYPDGHVINSGGDLNLYGSGQVYLRSNGSNFTCENGSGNISTGSSGTYKPGGGPWQQSSDARGKTVLGEYEAGLVEVCKLRPVRYRYKGNVRTNRDATPLHEQAAREGREFIGLVAQDVEGVMPEMVHRIPGGMLDGIEVDDLRGMDTTALIYALVNAVRELSGRVAALTARP